MWQEIFCGQERAAYSVGSPCPLCRETNLMIKCPMCRHILSDENVQKCPKCQADLTLLTDYVSHLRDGLAQAESLTREGELGEAVWAYLSVLEVDPDNATARRQVGKVVTAVRQFDQAAPGRRWLQALQRDKQQRRGDTGGEGSGGSWWGWLLLFLFVFASVVGAYYLGLHTARTENAPVKQSEDEEAVGKGKDEKKKHTNQSSPLRGEKKPEKDLGAGK